jgi:hypothetical protein
MQPMRQFYNTPLFFSSHFSNRDPRKIRNKEKTAWLSAVSGLQSGVSPWTTIPVPLNVRVWPGVPGNIMKFDHYGVHIRTNMCIV